MRWLPYLRSDMTCIVPVPLPLAGDPLVHFARRIDVVGWPLERA